MFQLKAELNKQTLNGANNRRTKIVQAGTSHSNTELFGREGMRRSDPKVRNSPPVAQPG